MRHIITLLAMMVATPGVAISAESLDAATILERATEAAGGDAWANARTLMLAGHAIFYGPASPQVRSTADDYRMWRVYDPQRKASHSAEGKVLIAARSAGTTLFTVGYDGLTTWNDKGVIPKSEADAYWASNFGFGIIRRARDPGFCAQRVPDDTIADHKLYMVRLTDPDGGITLFGIDADSYAIRTMAFMTPKGWHVRTYDDFVLLKNPRWLQARHVTLLYNGVKQNEVFWTSVEVNKPIDDRQFEYRTSSKTVGDGGNH